MPWQRVIKHVSDERVVVRSRAGEEYPVAVEYDHIGRGIYSQLHNIADTQHKRDYEKVIWAWVNFDADPVRVEHWTPGEADDPPSKPPWER